MPSACRAGKAAETNPERGSTQPLNESFRDMELEYPARRPAPEVPHGVSKPVSRTGLAEGYFSMISMR